MNKLIKGLFGLFVLVSVGEINAQTFRTFQTTTQEITYTNRTLSDGSVVVETVVETVVVDLTPNPVTAESTVSTDTKEETFSSLKLQQLLFKQLLLLLNLVLPRATLLSPKQWPLKLMIMTKLKIAAAMFLKKLPMLKLSMVFQHLQLLMMTPLKLTMLSPLKEQNLQQSLRKLKQSYPKTNEQIKTFSIIFSNTWRIAPCGHHRF